MTWLNHKVAIITGAGRGIGKGIVEGFVVEKAHVVAGDIIEFGASDLEDLRRITEDRGGEIYPVKVDVTDGQSVSEMVEKTINRFGRIDVLVNAAGVVSVSVVLEMKEQEWDHVMGVNAKGVFLCSKAVLPYLISSGEGRIINIASVAARVGRYGYSHYVASKHAVLGFSNPDYSSKGLSKASGIC
jgi:meso-butanediol dehydrogenase/(S,S)-butanediol dehydrogenase/diacetyl reductase